MQFCMSNRAILQKGILLEKALIFCLDKYSFEGQETQKKIDDFMKFKEMVF